MLPAPCSQSVHIHKQRRLIAFANQCKKYLRTFSQKVRPWRRGYSIPLPSRLEADLAGKQYPVSPRPWGKSGTMVPAGDELRRRNVWKVRVYPLQDVFSYFGGVAVAVAIQGCVAERSDALLDGGEERIIAYRSYLVLPKTSQVSMLYLARENFQLQFGRKGRAWGYKLHGVRRWGV
jgi:hypothetical protein